MASSHGESSSYKSHYFMAQNDKERDSWIEAVNKAKLVCDTCVIDYNVILY